LEKITKIPPELEARFPEFVQKWLNIGLCTDRIDPVASVPATNLSYKCAELPTPGHMVICESPYQGCVISYFAQEDKILEIIETGKYFDLLPINDINGQKIYKISGEKFKQLEEDYCSQKSISEILRDQMSNCIYGSLEGSWLSFYDVFGEMIDEIRQKIEGLIQVAKSCGFLWVYDEMAIITDRPEVIDMMDDRLHCEDGPAIKYTDNFSVYAWKGIRIQERLIEEKESITADEILKETNAEMRRIKLEIFGEANFIEKSNAKPVHQDDFGTLYKIDMEDDEPLCMVKVVNSTPEPSPDEDGNLVYKDYFLGVPEHCKTAKEAVAWTWDMTEEEYDPEQQT